jgi:hypothetical protein
MEIGNIHLFSDKLSKADKSLTGVHRRDGGISQLDFILGIAGPSGRSIAVIPEGPYVMPRYQSARPAGR